MTSSSNGRLTTDTVSNIDPHYARMLREWKRKFLGNWNSIIAPALHEEYGLSEEDLLIFKRKRICTFSTALSQILHSDGSNLIFYKITCDFLFNL